MEKNGLLSIVVLSWNHEKYIGQCLTSLINQTYRNIEINYVDNDSQDRTFEIGVKLLESSGIKYSAKQFDENLGTCKALNYAIKHLCNGEFIGIMSGDDWIDVTNYEKKIAYKEKKTSYKIVYSDGYAYYDDNGQTSLMSSNTSCKEGKIFTDLLRVNFLFTQGILILKEVFDKIGYYDESSTVEDWDFSLRAAQEFEIGYINEPLFYWRRHSQSYSYGLRPDKFYEDVLSTINQYKKYPDYKAGVKWAAFEYISEKMWPIYSPKSWKYLWKYPFLVIPMLRKRSIENHFLSGIGKVLKPLKRFSR